MAEFCVERILVYAAFRFGVIGFIDAHVFLYRVSIPHFLQTLQLLTINLLIKNHMARSPLIECWLFGLRMIVTAEPEGDVFPSKAKEIQYIVHELLVVHDAVVVKMDSD